MGKFRREGMRVEGRRGERVVTRDSRVVRGEKRKRGGS
jgi:hypothetical protein